MNQIIPFKYEQNEIRVIQDEQGEPWWVAKDVAEVLGIDRGSRIVERLEEDEVRQTSLIDSIGRSQQTYIVNESGLYALILRSDKPEAKPFRKWITSEVIPSIRKTGSYSLAKPITLVPLTKEFRAALSLAKAIGFEGNQAIVSANKAVKKLTSFDCLEIMDTPKLTCEVQERDYPPVGIGKQFLNGASAQFVNKKLEKAGLQEARRGHRDNQYWVPTEKGKPYSVLKDTGKAYSDGTPIQQLMWKESVVELLKETSPMVAVK